MRLIAWPPGAFVPRWPQIGVYLCRRSLRIASTWTVRGIVHMHYWRLRWFGCVLDADGQPVTVWWPPQFLYTHARDPFHDA